MLKQQEGENRFSPIYPLNCPLKEKIRTIAAEIYGAGEVVYTPAAEKQLALLEQNGYGGLPVCVAKTQYSLSDDAALLGRPKGFAITTVSYTHLWQHRRKQWCWPFY